jgi:hypothetical protein
MAAGVDLLWRHLVEKTSLTQGRGWSLGGFRATVLAHAVAEVRGSTADPTRNSFCSKGRGAPLMKTR